jgi:acyl carrier protein
MNRQEIEELILTTLKEVLDALDGQRPDTLGKDTIIFGANGLLDSMGLVTFITDLEDRIEEEFGTALILTDERAMSQRKSPFKTVSFLGQYVNTLIQEEN